MKEYRLDTCRWIKMTIVSFTRMIDGGFVREINEPSPLRLVQKEPFPSSSSTRLAMESHTVFYTSLGVCSSKWTESSDGQEARPGPDLVAPLQTASLLASQTAHNYFHPLSGHDHDHDHGLDCLLRSIAISHSCGWTLPAHALLRPN